MMERPMDSRERKVPFLLPRRRSSFPQARSNPRRMQIDPDLVRPAARQDAIAIM
jgi:hypothetical protein